MDTNAIWGAVLIVYIVPYFFWAIARQQSIDTRRDLYPGRKNEDESEDRSMQYGLLWSTGVAFLLFGWWKSWHPIGTFLILCVAASVVGVGIFIYQRRSLPKSQSFRLWLAGTVTWMLVVIAWYLIFQDETSMEISQFLMIGAFPPIIAAAAVVAFTWARAGAK